MKEQNEKQIEREQSLRRFWLSLLIIGASIAILAIASFKNYQSESPLEPETIFTAIVGLVGSWVGAIIAFYYSKDNFESANRNTQELVNKITKDKLESILAKDAMMSLSKMNYYSIEQDKSEDKVLLIDLREKLGNYNRLPILASDNSPKYILYRSVLDKYISQKVVDDKFKVEDVKKLTLHSMLSEGNSKSFLKAVITVREDDTLSTIKSMMEKKVIPDDKNKEVNVADAFITEDGTPDSAVHGWLTNVMISQRSKV